MKKILTILLIIIIPLQISAQQIQEKPQKFENFKKDKIFKKKNVDSKRLHYRVATAQKQITKLSVNAIKQLDSLITQQRDQGTGEFINSWKEEYTYDDDNAMIQLTYFIWNTATGQWVYDYRDDYTYNANKNIAVAIYSFWNTNTNQWVFDYKDEYAYDTNGNIASLVYYDWNNFSNQWVNDWKDDYTYDSGVLISLQDYYWDTQTSQWIPDIYLYSLYKTFGPHLGLMYVNKALIVKMENQSHFFKEGITRSMLTPAGPDHAQIAAASGILDYFDAVYEHHFDEKAPPAQRNRALNRLFQEHEKALLERLLDFLRSRDDVQIVGPDSIKERAPIVSIIPINKNIKKVYATLIKHKLMLGLGNFYAVRPLIDMGIPRQPGVLRISFLHYTSMEEIDQLIAGLKVALEN